MSLGDRLFFNGWNIHSWQKGGLVSSVPSKFGGGVYEHHSSVWIFGVSPKAHRPKPELRQDFRAPPPPRLKWREVASACQPVTVTITWWCTSS